MVTDNQRATLWRAKLRALARDHFDRVDGVDHAAPWGAALDSDGAWTALIEHAPARSFGQALVLAARGEATSLDLLVGEDEAIVARRAQLFDPSPTVWKVVETQLTAAEVEPRHAIVNAVELTTHNAQLLELGDVDIVTEHGVTFGECRGLEVARVTGEGAEQRVDVGVGAYDQGAFAVMNPEMTPIESLAEVVAQVLTHRRRGALPHPINRFARERWVRSALLDDPTQIGLANLTVVEPIEPREGIKDRASASAIGERPTGERVLISCTVGIDLDAVPAAADLADLHRADSVMIVLPDRDRHPLVQAIARRCRRPVEFVTSPEPWSDDRPVR